jgi:hypothetical protein
MRRAVASGLLLAGLAVMVHLLTQESTELVHLVLVGGTTGLAAGGICWRWRGALIGAVAGCLLGLIAPALYGPFWLIFTLPPHPEVDL